VQAETEAQSKEEAEVEEEIELKEPVIAMPVSPKPRSNRKSDIDPLVEKMQAVKVNDKKIHVEHPSLVSVFTKNGREIVSVDILAFSGTERHMYDTTISEDGRSIEVTYKINDYFMSPEWIKAASNQRYNDDSSRVSEFIKAASKLMDNGIAKKTNIKSTTRINHIEATTVKDQKKTTTIKNLPKPTKTTTIRRGKYIIE